MADDKKNYKEASNIFHSIIKASVSKTATVKTEIKPKNKPKHKGDGKA